MTSGPWLLSKRTDLLLFGGSTLAALLFLGVGAVTGDLQSDAPLWTWLLTVVGIDVAHVWATGWRVLADGQELRRRAALYLGVPAIAYAVGVVAYASDPLLFWRLLAYLAAFHFVRQQYGWVALYRRKNGESEGRLVDSVAIYASTVGPLVWWHARLPRRFHWLIAGDFLPGLPPALGTAAMVVMGLALALYAAKEIGRARRGLPLSWGKSLVVASTALTWTLGIVVFDSDYAFTVTNVITHGVPYFGLVYVTSRAGSTRPRPWAAGAALFLLPLIVLAFAEEWGWDRFVWHEYGAVFPGRALNPGPWALSLLVPLLALPQATHYVLDAFVWRVRKENAPAVDALGLAA